MKRFEDMTLEELWRLFPIVLASPNPDWKDWAAEEMAHLRLATGNLVTGVHHIGSTAIKGIWAKPIIDILVETPDVCNFEPLKHIVADSGYICMNATAGRFDFNKGYTPAGFADKVFHLHLRLTGDNDELHFRDYLNKHPEVAKEYERLKLTLWKRFEHNRDAYTAAKSQFVTRYTALAKQP